MTPGAALPQGAPRPQGFGQGYRAGSTEDPWNRNWTPHPSLPDTELSRHMTYMWGRSYDLHRNNILVSGPTSTLAALVGELFPQSLADSPDDRKALEQLWQEWAEQTGSDGVSSLAQQCEYLVGNASQGGDVLVLLDERPDLGGPIPLRLNLVDAWRIAYPSGKDDAGRTVSMGVAKKDGVEVGYYVYKGDEAGGHYYFERVREGRPNAILFRRPDPTRRPGQTRTPPVAAAAFDTLKDTSDHARHHGRSAGSRSRQKAVIQAGDPEEVKKIFAQAKQLEEAGLKDAAMMVRQSAKMYVAETPEASVLVLPKWADYKTLPTDTVDPSFEAYFEGRQKSVAPAWGLPFEMAYKRMDGANLSRARIHHLQAGFESRRWIRDLGTTVFRHVWRLFVQYAWSYGHIKRRPTPDMYRVRWSGQPQEYLDLGAEIGAYSDAQASGIMSPQAIARRNNTDVFVTMTERIEYAQEFKRRCIEAGLSDEDLNAAFGSRKSAPATAPAPAKTNEDPAA